MVDRTAQEDSPPDRTAVHQLMPDFTAPYRRDLSRGRLSPIMPNPPWMVNIAVPADLREFIASRRIHHRQAYHEIIAQALRSASQPAVKPTKRQNAPTRSSATDVTRK